MNLDVIVATYNRSRLLQMAISSLLRAPVPTGLDVTIWIVDNNSKDDTESAVREIQPNASIPCHYIKETNQGLSHARNAGICAGTGELIGFIDDDEQIDANWYTVVAREFADQAIQFIGGPYLPNWTVPPPNWLPPSSYGAIGVTAQLSRSAFAGQFTCELWGGNAVIRRSVFESIGLFSTKLGRGAKGLLMNEDQELQDRIVGAGFYGMYVPELIIYHHIPVERLSRRYHRRWRYWDGVSAGISGRELNEPVKYILGIPRYKISQTLRGLASLPRHLFLTRETREAFADELPFWHLLGYIFGRHFIRVAQEPKKQ